jgi:membrane protein
MDRSLFRLFGDAADAWLQDRAPTMGAALSYYTAFSIAPLLLIALSVAGLVFGDDAVRGEVFAQLRGLMGSEGAAAIESLLQTAQQPTESMLGTAVGLVVLLVGATTVFAELQDSLDAIWRVPPREGTGWWLWLRARVVSFGMILAVGFLLMVSLIISAALEALQTWWAPFFGAWARSLQVVNLTVGFLVTTAIFAMIYKWIPRVRIAWRDVWIGAAVTALLFGIGRYLIGLYIGRSGVSSSFGAAGSLVVVLVWVYFSAQIFLYGAEFTRLYAGRHGSHRGAAERGEPDVAAPDTGQPRLP